MGLYSRYARLQAELALTKVLAASGGWPNLSEPLPAHVMQGLKSFPGEMPYLRICDWTPDEPSLAAACQARGLKWLRLNNTRLTADQLQVLSLATDLTTLDLSETPLDDQALQVIAGLPQRLTFLRITGCGVSAEQQAKLQAQRPGLEIRD